MLVKALIATEDVASTTMPASTRKPWPARCGPWCAAKSAAAATITQQLAKNLYKTRRDETSGVLGYIPVVSTLISKTKEWLTAVELERRYTKEEILRMYLNTVEYGSQAFGIKVAAKTFFSTSPDSLKPEEAAMLVGMLNNPTAYNPTFSPRSCAQAPQLGADPHGPGRAFDRRTS